LQAASLWQRPGMPGDRSGAAAAGQRGGQQRREGRDRGDGDAGRGGSVLHSGRAAEQLHVVPAVVGQRIRDLETELGLRLFHRTSRTVTLTRGGAALLDPAIAALAGVAEVAHLARSLGAGTTGRVVVGLAPNSGRFATQVIAAISDGLPGVEVTARSLFTDPALADSTPTRARRPSSANPNRVHAMSQSRSGAPRTSTSRPRRRTPPQTPGGSRSETSRTGPGSSSTAPTPNASTTAPWPSSASTGSHPAGDTTACRTTRSSRRSSPAPGRVPRARARLRADQPGHRRARAREPAPRYTLRLV